MEGKTKQILVGIAALVAAYLLAEIVFSTVMAVLIGFAVGATVVVFLLARSRGEMPRDVAQEAAQQALRPGPGAGERPVHEQLCRVNQRIRLEGTPAAVVTATEELIDLLRETAPRAQQEAPRSETTFDLVRLATDHLPKLVGEFLDLSPSDRAAQQEALTQQLGSLTAHVVKIRDHLDQGQRHEFDAAHGFVDIKFNTAH